MFQFQILQTNITRIVLQTVRRITNEILGSSRVKMMSWIKHALWLVLSYDLLGDRCTDDVTIDSIFNFFYHIQPTAIDHRRDQNVVRIIASMTHGSVLCATFFPFNLAHFYVICDIYYRTVALQNRIQFLKWIPTFYFLEGNLLEWNKFGSNDYWKYMKIIYVRCGEEMRYKRSSHLWTLLN